MTEMWKPIEGFEDSYEVSNTGLVRSIDRQDKSRPFTRIIKGRPASIHENAAGYLYVTLSKGGKNKHMFVHVAVATAFVAGKAPGLQVRHGDGVKRNNNDWNLSWGTAKENAADREIHGTTARGSKNGNAALNEKQVKEMRERFAAGENCNQLSKAFGIAYNTAKRIVTNEFWKSS